MTKLIELYGTRVRVSTPAGEVLGRLSGAPADGRLFLRELEQPYAERVLAASDVLVVEPAPLRCSVGEGHDAETLTDGLCADHAREAAARAGAKTENCDQCGGPFAFRSPRDRRNVYLCVGCHVEAGSLSGLGVESRVLETVSAVRTAVCRGADEDDERHVWHRVKGSQHRCKICQAPRYSTPRT